MYPDIKYWRNPTPQEIKFGEGAIHYRSFYGYECHNENYEPKKWFKADNGLRYNLCK